MKSSEVPLARIVFFQVKDPAAKLQRIAETARAHFGKKERFIIFVEDLKAQSFVDELLWKMPDASFLPHAAADVASQEWVAITKTKTNVNGARVAFNLCSTPLLIDGSFRLIYELEDLTSPAKQKLSTIRYDAYKNAYHPVEAR